MDYQGDFVRDELLGREFGSGPIDPDFSFEVGKSSARTFLPVSGVWRRIGAFVLDVLLLGMVLQVVAFVRASFWFGIGPYGRFAGLAVALAYFGLMDSSIGDGRTLGKRATGIALVGEDGQTVGPGRSFLRAAIVFVPIMLNGWALPLLACPIGSWISSFIVVGVGGAVGTTMVFNRSARQGLQDMICRTYVVRRKGDPVVAFPVTARAQWVVSAVVIALAVVGVSASLLLVRHGHIASLYSLQQTLQGDPRFFSAEVTDRTYYSASENVHELQISVWYKGAPSDDESGQAMRDVAGAALQSVPDIYQYDQMRIQVSSAYDLGLATGNRYVGRVNWPAAWRQEIEESGQQ